VDESGKVLDEIVTRVKKVTDVMAEIANSSREQASGIEQVNKAVTLMDTMTQQNAVLVEEDIAAAQALTAQATGLIKLIAHFRRSESTQSNRGNDPRAKSAAELPISGHRAHG
jgi:methyl-accepting chemotaxis protein